MSKPSSVKAASKLKPKSKPALQGNNNTPLATQAKELLEKANDLVADVDEAEIFKTASQQQVRKFPIFDTKELEIGTKLGIGGFSVVSEVSNIIPTVDAEECCPKDDQNGGNANGSSKNNSNNIQSEDETRGSFADCMGADKEHYHVDEAKEIMASRCFRYGNARYAIKRLRSDLNELDHVRGMIDLAIEVKYFSVLWHPNIVKMRAVSSGPTINPSTFILMDRLYGTLEEKIEEWADVKKDNKGNIFGIGKNNDVLVKILQDRLLVAYDIAAAMNYLHKQKLVYRDLKPENIGFDIRGDCKVFDFGLLKSLERKSKARGYGYNLTPRTGSIPYMAPEVAKSEPYSKEADVFSFAILLWEILSLKWAFNGFSAQEYYQRVVMKNERLPLKYGKSWPALMRTIISESWHEDPSKRPTMKRIAMLIRSDLTDMTNDDNVANRTTHMKNRSLHSMHLKLEDAEEEPVRDALQ